jgi:hypothetical protein
MIPPMFGIENFGLFLTAGILLNLTRGRIRLTSWVAALPKVVAPALHLRWASASEVCSTHWRRL